MIITLYPKETPGESIDIEIICCWNLPGARAWNVDLNKVYLGHDLYREFCSIEQQSDKRKFFNGLKKFSNRELI